MPVVAIYNNKGGVGKSTLTVGLAEFLAANRRRSVLVIDLDAQASSSGSILGRTALALAIESRRTVAQFAELARAGKAPKHIAPFVTERPASTARGTNLEKVDVLVPDKPRMLSLEEAMSHPRDTLAVRDGIKQAVSAYDFVLVDLPGNIDRRSRLAMAALAMSDFVLIPVEPTQISLNALPDTFDLIHHAREFNKNGRPAVVGLVLNKADKRTEQYRSKFGPILQASARGELPPVFENAIPDTPKLATATDEMHDFTTLKERFDTYYDHVRKVARELEEKCQSQIVPAPNIASVGYGGVLKGIFAAFANRRKKATSRASTTT